jgi:dTMP kinase
MDMNLSNDPYESYRIFQNRVIDQYESMVGSEGFIIIDGTSGIEEQQQIVRDHFKSIIHRNHSQLKGLRRNNMEISA